MFCNGNDHYMGSSGKWGCMSPPTEHCCKALAASHILPLTCTHTHAPPLVGSSLHRLLHTVGAQPMHLGLRYCGSDHLIRKECSGCPGWLGGRKSHSWPANRGHMRSLWHLEFPEVIFCSSSSSSSKWCSILLDRLWASGTVTWSQGSVCSFTPIGQGWVTAGNCAAS